METRPKKESRALSKDGLKQANSSSELVEMPGDTPAADAVKIFGASPGKLYLTIKRPEKYPVGPIALGPAETVINVEKFAEITIKDVVLGIDAINRGHLHHWAVSLIDEKIEKLRLCGVEVEIRSTGSPQKPIGESELQELIDLTLAEKKENKKCQY